MQEWISLHENSLMSNCQISFVDDTNSVYNWARIQEIVVHKLSHN